ncbi:lasso peptide biosynthesis B2 protein [Bacillus sp. HB172195]|uniref:Lasso peptide biosynthesis B2 protein n=1 Tax=Exobacillus caeni TaxID=2574798 RepID=A0A5R9F549_9BACL|nr:lasso peptide biosynthesis B2 protein [Pseudalkalibacillus caeni]
MNNKTKFLLIEAFFYLGYARVIKSLPFNKALSYVGLENKETTFDADYSVVDVRTIKEISQIISIMSHHTPWESKCLVKAIACLKMLERRYIESTLYLGTGKDEAGKMIAHAWLRSGPYYITGSEGMDRFKVVGTFAKRIKVSRREEHAQ